MNTKSMIHAALVGFSLIGIAGPAMGSTTISTTRALGAGEPEDSAFDEKAIEVIERSIEALGGREKLSKVKSVEQTGTISIPMAQIKGTLEMYISSPDRFLLRIDMPETGVNLQGLSGGIAWSMDPMSGPRLLSDEEAKQSIDQADLQAQLAYRQDNKSIQYMGEVEFDGKKADKIKLLDKDDEESIQYYAVESGLQIGSEAQTQSQMGKVLATTYMRDYKELDGHLQPSAVMQKIGPLEIYFTFEHAEYNGVKDEVFELPDPVKALVEATKAIPVEEPEGP